MNNDIYQFIRDVITTDLVESEYDGTMMQMCFSCGTQNNNHDSDCLVVLGQQLLDTHFADQEQQRIDEIHHKQKQLLDQHNLMLYTQVQCIHCRQVVQKRNLILHTFSKRCIKNQRALGLTVINLPVKQQVPKQTKTKQQQYEHNKHVAKVGEMMECPCCFRPFVKRTYQNVFYNLAHKDRYWNKVRG